MPENINPASTDSGARAVPNRAATSPLLVAAAWLVVIVPAAWGVTQTVRTSTGLFKTPPASSNAPTAPNAAH